MLSQPVYFSFIGGISLAAFGGVTLGWLANSLDSADRGLIYNRFFNSSETHRAISIFAPMVCSAAVYLHFIATIPLRRTLSLR